MSDDQPAVRTAGTALQRVLDTPARLVTVLASAAVAGGLAGGLIVSATNGTASGAPDATAPSVCAAAEVAAMGLPSVVTIAARSADGRQSGTGTGEIIRTGGYVLTNNHVISVAAAGGSVTVVYDDGRSSAAVIVGRDPLTDLAVLRVSDGASGLPPIALGSSQALTVGQPVVALGAPLGLSGTVTAGIVSAVDRDVPVPGDDGQSALIAGAIQTDAAINPGNSGGPLVDCSARLVGVNTAIATVPNAAGESGGGSVGLGFAIPADVAVPIADEIIATGSVTHLTVGVEVRAIPSFLAGRLGLPPGLLVDSVMPGGPADRAGIAPRDILTAINGAQAVSADQLTVAELAARAGRAVELSYLRSGTTRTASLTAVPQA